MFDFIKKLFGPGTDFKALMEKGAQIIDVRSPGEFQGGHVEGSVNIALQDLKNSLSRIDKNKPVITCCASGMRSSSAKSVLLSNGYTEVYNGGGWMALERKIT